MLLKPQEEDKKVENVTVGHQVLDFLDKVLMTEANELWVFQLLVLLQVL
jgi:hypothetical protein